MGVAVPTINNYARDSLLSPNCQRDLLEIVVITSGIELMDSFELFGTSIGQDEIRQQNKRTQRSFTDDINAIACGVEAWFEENTSHSANVAGMTIEIARKLGVPEKEIRKWAARRSTFNSGRVRPIKSLLERLHLDPPAERLRNIKGE